MNFIQEYVFLLKIKLFCRYQFLLGQSGRKLYIKLKIFKIKTFKKMYLLMTTVWWTIYNFYILELR